MRVTLAYNLRREESEAEAELLSRTDLETLLAALEELPYQITPVEVSGPTDQVIAELRLFSIPCSAPGG